MDYQLRLLHYSHMILNLGNWGKHIDVLSVAIYEHGTRDWEWKPEPVEHFNLWLALEGAGTIEYQGQTSSFSAGSFFLFCPHTSIVGYSAEKLRLTNFSAHLKATGKTAALLTRLGQNARPIHFRHLVWVSHFLRYLSETFYLSPVEGRDLVVSGLALLLQSGNYEETCPPGDPAGNTIIQTIERIRRNPAAAYSVGEMAAMARLSTAQFTRRFKAIASLTPNRFIVEERLAWAERYLRETDMPVQEIASRLGYRDVFFFSRQFRRFRGMSPIAVRRGEKTIETQANGHP
jgi:AraC-like DNA-binding protein